MPDGPPSVLRAAPALDDAPEPSSSSSSSEVESEFESQLVHRAGGIPAQAVPGSSTSRTPDENRGAGAAGSRGTQYEEGSRGHGRAVRRGDREEVEDEDDKQHAAWERQRLLRKRKDTLTQLFSALDFLVYIELAALYYLDTSTLLLIVRLTTHVAPLQSVLSLLASIRTTHSHSSIGLVLVSNIIAILVHIFANLPQAGEATRFDLHGHLFIDLIGQRALIGWTGRLRLVCMDLVVLALQGIAVGCAVELERKGWSKKGQAATSRTAMLGRSSAQQQLSELIGEEDVGVLNDGPMTGPGNAGGVSAGDPGTAGASRLVTQSDTRARAGAGQGSNRQTRIASSRQRADGHEDADDGIEMQSMNGHAAQSRRQRNANGSEDIQDLDQGSGFHGDPESASGPRPGSNSQGEETAAAAAAAETEDEQDYGDEEAEDPISSNDRTRLLPQRQEKQHRRTSTQSQSQSETLTTSSALRGLNSLYSGQAVVLDVNFWHLIHTDYWNRMNRSLAGRV